MKNKKKTLTTIVIANESSASSPSCERLPKKENSLIAREIFKIEIKKSLKYTKEYENTLSCAKKKTKPLSHTNKKKPLKINWNLI